MGGAYPLVLHVYACMYMQQKARPFKRCFLQPYQGFIQDFWGRGNLDVLKCVCAQWCTR